MSNVSKLCKAERRALESVEPPKPLSSWVGFPFDWIACATEIVKFPTGIGVGRAAVTTGILLKSVMAEAALVECESAALTALIVKLVDFGSTAGAV